MFSFSSCFAVSMLFSYFEFPSVSKKRNALFKVEVDLTIKLVYRH